GYETVDHFGSSIQNAWSPGGRGWGCPAPGTLAAGVGSPSLAWAARRALDWRACSAHPGARHPHPRPPGFTVVSRRSRERMSLPVTRTFSAVTIVPSAPKGLPRGLVPHLAGVGEDGAGEYFVVPVDGERAVLQGRLQQVEEVAG